MFQLVLSFVNSLYVLIIKGADLVQILTTDAHVVLFILHRVLTC